MASIDKQKKYIYMLLFVPSYIKKCQHIKYFWKFMSTDPDLVPFRCWNICSNPSYPVVICTLCTMDYSWSTSQILLLTQILWKYPKKYDVVGFWSLEMLTHFWNKYESRNSSFLIIPGIRTPAPEYFFGLTKNSHFYVWLGNVSIIFTMWNYQPHFDQK